MHWDGSAYEAIDSGTDRNLLTINGRPDGSLVTAVGGSLTGTLVQGDGSGSAWADVTPGEVKQPFGVVHTQEEGWAVGFEGQVLHFDGAAWAVHETDLEEVFGGLHSVWVDPEGGVWAAGGKIVAGFDGGTLDYRGRNPPTSELSE